MPKEEFNKNFSSEGFPVDTRLNQANVGDCYAIAAIHAMASSPQFEMIARSSMKKLPNGSWAVKIPLLSEKSETVIITPADLLPQKNEQFLKKKGGAGARDMRKTLKPVQGTEGLRVLEAAYIKNKFGKVDRLKAEGGRGDEALLKLGGENFEQYSVSAIKYDPEKEKLESPGLDSLPESGMAYLDNYLENFDPEIHIATVGSKHIDTRTVSGITAKAVGFYKGTDTSKFFVPGHAYSISNVDAKNKMITLANPWDTSKPIEMTFDQFKGSFSSLRAIRVNSAKLLKNIENVSKKAA